MKQIARIPEDLRIRQDRIRIPGIIVSLNPAVLGIFDLFTLCHKCVRIPD
jgi:hypothetical protein